MVMKCLLALLILNSQVAVVSCSVNLHFHSMKSIAIFLIFGLVAVTSAGDPSDGWLSYAEYKAPPTSKITFLNMSWVVPEHPEKSFGSNAPGWWFGVQTDDGNGALIQPILAWDYQGSSFSIFNAVFDWNDQVPPLKPTHKTTHTPAVLASV